MEFIISKRRNKKKGDNIMTIQELDKEIELRKTELIDDDKKEAYNYIINFINNNKIDNILDYINMDIWEFLKCSIYINRNKKDINKCSSDIDSYKELFNSIKIDTIEYEYFYKSK